MDNRPRRVGQRMSLKTQTCTIRYFGPVAEKPGEWLGLEWDDPARGKHDGTHEGVPYFTCKTSTSKLSNVLQSSD